MKPGERIRYFRKNKGLNQSEFAEKIGFSDAYLSEIETGKKEPSDEFLNRLEQIFKIPREYILYSGTHAQWEKIESDLRAQGLDDLTLEKIKPHYLVALVLGGKEEFQRGFNQGMLACESGAEYKALSPSKRKLLDDVKEILGNGPQDVVTALEANIKVFLGSTRTAKERRVYPRSILTVPIDLEIVDRPGEHAGIVINVSQLGLLIQTPHDMAVGEIVFIMVLIGKEAGDESFRTKGEIIWKEKKQVEREGGAEEYQYGVKLLEVLDEGHTKIDFLVHGYLDKQKVSEGDRE